MRSKITISAFVIMLAVFVYIGIFAPKDVASVREENREIKQMPKFSAETLFGGTFSKDFEDYLADNVGFRGKFTALSAKLNTYKGVTSKYGTLVSVNKGLGVGESSKGSLIILDDKIMEIYREDKSALNMYVKTLNKYAKTMPKSVNIYSMLIPTQIEFECPKTGDSQKKTIDAVYKAEDERIKTINVYDSLKKNTDDYIYFRTDHHWTQRGAYLGYCELAKKAGFDSVKLSDLQEDSRKGFLGYLYNQANDPDMKKYADTIEWFTRTENFTVSAHDKDENGKYIDYETKMYNIPADEAKPKYSVFMGGDHSYLKMTSDIKNGKTICVIKDSYGNAMLPLLTNSYETVIAVDPRSYDGKVSELVKKEKVDDLLILNYTFTTTFKDFIEKIEEIR